MKKLSILLAENYELVRKGVKMLINEEPDLEVIGEADNGDSVVELAQELAPDIIVMGISMPQTNGLYATKKLKEISPDLKILILSRHRDSGRIHQLIQAGVNGYVLKQSSPSELISAIRAISDGNSYLDPIVTQAVMDIYARQINGLKGEVIPEITAREESVLQLIAQGHTNKNIAEQLDISVKTVDTHRANAIRKLGISDRVGIVNYAIFKGWMNDI